MASKQIDPSQTGAVSSRSTGFHQRKISLTTACPPTGRPDSKHHPSYANFLNQQLSANPLSPSSSYWYKRLYRWRIVRVIVWAYILLSVGLFTLHILSSIWPTESKGKSQKQNLSSCCLFCLACQFRTRGIEQRQKQITPASGGHVLKVY
ncbi:uncharacterized protein BYT42DRAFT_18925 [Radiomyces spectabilis]|uniref:uncharacterized protein n=1 Tax=Radiomyces spectabilis TaxID=64574 RepID=UPI002220F976|nr:uncharacterized protein BYT42DRAFT_18925 [Radiomyces spectabilis]KAI8393792.1 hypothetical protein BYT42DRAFT_18925 [Radiomyces spectabilis]